MSIYCALPVVINQTLIYTVIKTKNLENDYDKSADLFIRYNC